MSRRQRIDTADSRDADRRASRTLLPHKLLLRVSRGIPVDGHTASFAQRLSAAKQVLPYYAARLSPQAGNDGGSRPFNVTIVRFSGADDSAGSGGTLPALPPLP